MHGHEISVQGFCPMGCGPTLVLPENGRVTCGARDCPDPTIVTRILADQETEHVVVFGYDPQARLYAFAIVHPLRERAGQIETCELHREILALGRPPAPPGRYRGVRSEERGLPIPGWDFERIDL